MENLKHLLRTAKEVSRKTKHKDEPALKALYLWAKLQYLQKRYLYHVSLAAGPSNIERFLASFQVDK
jgi:hypothetical protein